MGIGLGVAFAFQPVDDFFDVLGVVLMRDQHRVLGGDDDDVLDAEQRSDGAVRAGIAVLAVLDEDLADRDIAVLVLIRDFGQSRPGADIGPADGGRDDDGLVGFLGHRVVDADIGGRLRRRWRRGG